jgi:hypothetical protein
MPKATKDTTPITMEMGLAVDRACQLDDITVNFTTIHKDHTSPRSWPTWPTGRCECPHWGFIFKGQMTASYARPTG